jgi:hypothetical protein
VRERRGSTLASRRAEIAPHRLSNDLGERPLLDLGAHSKLLRFVLIETNRDHDAVRSSFARNGMLEVHLVLELSEIGVSICLAMQLVYLLFSSFARSGPVDGHAVIGR